MKQKFKKLFLRCTFSEKEMADIALTMADKTQELKRIDANANAAAAQFKSDKEAAQNEVDGAARKYRDGYEMRDVECEETVDFESGVVRYWRCDNGDLAQERKLTNEERQMRLDEIEVEKEGRFDHLNHATEAVKQWPWWKREAAGFKGDTSKDDGPK